ncbi:unnamed protein product [Camellia sinensis]
MIFSYIKTDNNPHYPQNPTHKFFFPNFSLSVVLKKRMEKLSPSPSVAKLEKQPSLEEPLTLSHEQINALREAAMKVIKSHTREEAEKIFMAGMEPVILTPKTSPAPKVLEKRARR